MFTKKVREDLDEVDKRSFELKKQLAYARHLLSEASSCLEPDQAVDIEEFLINGLDVDYDEPSQIEMQHLKLDKERLQGEVSALNTKNHNLAKSMSNAMQACKRGYVALGWHFPEKEAVPVNLPGVVDELLKGLKEIDAVTDSANDPEKIVDDVRNVLGNYKL